MPRGLAWSCEDVGARVMNTEGASRKQLRHAGLLPHSEGRMSMARAVAMRWMGSDVRSQARGRFAQ